MRSVQWSISVVAGACLVLAGCRQDMHDQPKYKPYSQSKFYSDGRSERPFVEGTVARGHAHTDHLLYEGLEDGQPASRFPYRVTKQMIARGGERYQIFCVPCHGYLGDGGGMIVQRGLVQPPSYHTERLRNVPVGYFYGVITNGYGSMYSYASRVPVEDRWAIVAYIRALQLSQHAAPADVPTEAIAKMTDAKGASH